MATLDNYTTQNTYTNTGTLRFVPAELVTVIVTNNPIFAQFALVGFGPVRHPEAFDFEFEERRMLLASWTWSATDFNGKKIVGVRVRSAVAGAPAQVTIHA